MTSGARIYLDHNATAPLRAGVADAMARALALAPGNPSSIHAAGRAARDVIEDARRQVAALCGAEREDVVFTSGGSESNRLAILGLVDGARRDPAARLSGRAPHVVSSAIEHPSVLATLAWLRARGHDVTLLEPGPQGEIAPAAVRAALRDNTALVTLSAANHELGNRYPVAALAAAAHEGGARLHVDAVQIAGREPFDIGVLGVDAASVSAHKFGGPQGIGALILRRGLPFESAAGGGQERGRRAGTENVPGIAGMGEAARQARARVARDASRVRDLRDRLQAALLAIPGTRLHGDPVERTPGTLNVGFAGADGQLVVMGLDLEGVCVSHGAACSSGTVAPSPVLRAIGLGDRAAREAVRFSLGPENTVAEIDRAAALTAQVVARVRAAEVPRQAVVA